MIYIYPSKLEGEPIESHIISEIITIEGWLVKNVPSYKPSDNPPISIEVDGVTIPSELWPVACISNSNDVRITIEAKAFEPMTWLIIASVVLSVASLGFALLMRPKMPSLNQQTTRKGSKIDESNARGNKVKAGSIIKEIAGHFKTYPDYLLPNHTYFQNETEIITEMLLLVGKGSYDIDTSLIKIGDTSFNSLESYAEYSIYEPDADLSGDSSAVWWHSATEVGPSSSGGAGLELQATYLIDTIPTASAFDLNNFEITALDGKFPNTFTAGKKLTIEQRLNYTVIADSDADIIQGDFSSLQPFVGMVIEIVGDNEGDYVIASVNSDNTEITLETDGGDPVISLQTGAVIMSIGYRNQQYKIDSNEQDSNDDIIAITASRYTDTGVIDGTWTGFVNDSDQTVLIGLDQTEYEGEWVGPFAVCPSGEVTTQIEFDIYFPNGLVSIANDGGMNNFTVTIEIQYREISGVVWSSVQKTYTKNTLDQLGYTETINVPSGRYEAKARRITPVSSDTQIQDTVQLYGLKSRLAAPNSYADTTTMTVKISGGNNISGQSEQLINMEVTRKLPTRSNGSWTAPQATRSIIPWMAYVAKSIGYTDDDLDLAAMDELDALWNSRGDYFDTTIESASTVKAEILSCLKAGFAELTLDRGVMVPVRDHVRTVFDHMYTPQNITVNSFQRQFQAKQPDDYDGVDVEYVDADTWTKETVQCRLDGDEGRKVEKVVLEGVTDRTRAWRFGMRQRRAHKYRRWTYQFGTELDALNSRYMSYCALADDVPGYGQSAILLSVEQSGNNYILESSEPFEWETGAGHIVGIRRQDGTLSGPYAATRVDNYRLSITGLDFTPDTSWTLEPPHLIFGTTTRWSYPVLIAEITPNADNTVDVGAVNYDVRVYADDDNSP